MSDDVNDKLKANELRKKGDIISALPLYKNLWENTHDKFALAGLLFCYRRLKRYDEAIPLAEEAYSSFHNFDWCKNEYIWTLIQGKLDRFPEDGDLSNFISIVNKILGANPDEIALKVTILKLLKIAKKQKNWTVLNEWIDKIDHNILDGYTDKSTGWTDKELWFYYRINGLIYSHREHDAINIIENNVHEFYKQKHWFDRLKAKAFISLQDFKEAEKAYKPIISSKTDWWVLHEYGNLLLKLNNNEEALTYFMKAASRPPMKLELKVSLFSNIGELFIKLKKKDEALPHLQLAKEIREERGWNLNDLNQKISSLTGETKEKETIKSLLNKCEAIWKQFLDKEDFASEEALQKKNLKGKIIKLDQEKHYCFIKTRDNQTFFCSKADLPTGSVNNTIVQFDLKNSFDKKKNQKSFKAVNITIDH